MSTTRRRFLTFLAALPFVGKGLVEGLADPAPWRLDGPPVGRHFDRRVFDDRVSDESEFTPEMLDKCLKRAQGLSPQIRPITMGGTDYYVITPRPGNPYWEWIRNG